MTSCGCCTAKTQQQQTTVTTSSLITTILHTLTIHHVLTRFVKKKHPHIKGETSGDIICNKHDFLVES